MKIKLFTKSTKKKQRGATMGILIQNSQKGRVMTQNENERKIEKTFFIFCQE